MRKAQSPKHEQSLAAISLFCSGGIGDLAARDLGIEILVSNELLEDRLAIYCRNFPETTAILGDIWNKKEEIIAAARDRLDGRELDFVFATPPCQGMSPNGQGKLLNGIRKGLKPKFDPRNQLIIPTINVVSSLRPRTVVFENVPAMRNTVIEDPKGGTINILEYVARELGPAYEGRWAVVEFADYGVPQRRQRLITVFSRDPHLRRIMQKYDTALPPTTHSESGAGGKHRWITVRDTISDLPPLDARDRKHARSDIPFHYVPLLDKDKYFWVSNTPPEGGAFDNQCVECGYDRNPVHGTARDHKGINRAKTSTPIRCEKCGALLPRPWVKHNGEYRLMSGFTSAYKRMSWDKPASALTRNLSYACSDHKLHPEQHRVLSLYEAFRLHTVTDFDYVWARPDGKKVSDKTIREIIGESIPPRGLRIIYEFLQQAMQNPSAAEQRLWSAKPFRQESFQELLFIA